MEELLHWAVEHSDAEKLKEVMAKYQANNLTLKDVYGQDMIDALFYDEYEFVGGLITTVADFRNASLSDDELEGALMRLEEFVEQIDNAGNLHKMGGLAPLLDLALDGRRSSEVRVQALLTLGISVQNNEHVQEDLLSLDGLDRLAARLRRCVGASPAGAASASAAGAVCDALGVPAEAEAAAPLEGDKFCGKLLYAISGLVKNSGEIQTAASQRGVFSWMLRFGLAHPSTAVAKKSIGLLETVLAQSPELPFLASLDAAARAEVGSALLARVRGEEAAKAASFDIDAPEKALRLASRVLAARPMFFPEGFRARLASAASAAKAKCEAAFARGDELCEGLAALARECDSALAARDVSDDEL